MPVTKLIAGKHACVGHLSTGGVAASENNLDKEALLVYVGTFQSMDGEVDVTEGHIDAIVRNHNAKLEKFRLEEEDQIIRAMPPMQLDHSTSAAMTVGRVIGELYKGPFTREDGQSVPALYCKKLRTLGSENVEKVKDGRWVNLSIGADLEAGTLNEVSIVPFPAAPQAAMLAKQKLSEGEKMETKEEMKARHLAEKEALSAQHAEELKSKKLEEVKSKHEEALAKLQEKHAEELKKLGVEESPAGEEHLADDVVDTDGDHDDVKDAKAKMSKLSAAKPKVIELAKSFKKEASGARLAAKKGVITARLAKLQSQAKITPAERKKIDLAKLAGEKDEVVEARLKAYEEREPVIDPRVYGTTRATNLAALKKKIESVRLMAETKVDMGKELTEEEKKALSGQPVSAPEAMESEVRDHGGEEHMSHLAGLLGDHPAKEAVMAYCKKMMEGKSQLSDEVQKENLAEAESAEKQMSALAETVNRLHARNEELTALIGDVFGIEAADMTE